MMRKLYIFGLIGLAAVLIGLAWADQMTFTTYYPAPYGVYKEMKVHLVRVMPRSEEPSVPVGDEDKWKGKIYYNNGSGTSGTIEKGMYHYNGSNWVAIGRGGLGPPDYDEEQLTSKAEFTTFTHDLKNDLGVEDYMVYMEGKDLDGVYHNQAIGGCSYTPAGEGGPLPVEQQTPPYPIEDDYHRGAYWVNKGDNSIEVYRLADENKNELYDKTRIRLWKID